MYDMTDKTLVELAEIIRNASDDNELENAQYEIGFRQEMMEAMAKGGIRPTHQPPH